MIIQKNAKNRTVTVQWSSNDIKTDICMSHVIEMRVTFTDTWTGEEEWEELSLPAYYNADCKVYLQKCDLNTVHTAIHASAR